MSELKQFGTAEGIEKQPFPSIVSSGLLFQKNGASQKGDVLAGTTLSAEF